MNRRDFISGLLSVVSVPVMAMGSDRDGSRLKDKLLDFTDRITEAVRDGLTPRQAERSLEDFAGEWGFHVAYVQIFPEAGHHTVALGVIEKDGDESMVYKWQVADSLSGWKVKDA